MSEFAHYFCTNCGAALDCSGYAGEARICCPRCKHVREVEPEIRAAFGRNWDLMKSASATFEADENYDYDLSDEYVMVGDFDFEGDGDFYLDDADKSLTKNDIAKGLSEYARRHPEDIGVIDELASLTDVYSARESTIAKAREGLSAVGIFK